MLEPLYGPGVSQDLDLVEFDPKRKRLWVSIVETLNLICESPDGELARRYQLRLPSGEVVWRVKVPANQEDDDWAILWQPSGADAVIHYVGIWPPLRSRPKY